MSFADPPECHVYRKAINTFVLVVSDPWSSARRVRNENTQRQIRNDVGAKAFLDANVAVAVLRFSDHRPAEIDVLAPHHIFTAIAQFGARHWLAIIIVAAFLRIPRVRQHKCRDYQIFHGPKLVRAAAHRRHLRASTPPPANKQFRHF